MNQSEVGFYKMIREKLRKVKETLKERKFESARKIIGGILVVIGLWLWWEVHKMLAFTNATRHTLFPLPFYICCVPIWFVVDFSITLIIVAYILGVVEWENLFNR